MNDLKERYHKPDPRWQIWNVNNHQEHINMIVVLGKFHSNVPEVIIKEYEIVERLLTYSYYHYPLIDEAFSKLSRMFESSVKLRLKQLGIESSNKYESLNSRIKKLSKFSSKLLLKQWDSARKIRNHFAHAEAGSYGGIAIHRGFYQYINIINTIFLEKELIESNETDFKNFKLKAESFTNELYTVSLNKKNFLVHVLKPFSVFNKTESQISFWTLYPVLKKLPTDINDLNFDQPFYLRLSNVKFFSDRIEAVDITTKEIVKIYKTSDENYLEKLIEYNEMAKKSGSEILNLYSNF